MSSKLESQATHPILRRRIIVFLDGLCRATILPYAPILIRQLNVISNHFHNNNTNDNSNNSNNSHSNNAGTEVIYDSVITQAWSSIVWYTALLISLYSIGHALGIALSSHSPTLQLHLTRSYTPSSSSPSTHSTPTSNSYYSYYSSWTTLSFTRMVGIIVALHMFSFGSGMERYTSILGLRFITGLIIGIVSGVCRDTYIMDQTGNTSGSKINLKDSTNDLTIDQGGDYYNDTTTSKPTTIEKEQEQANIQNIKSPYLNLPTGMAKVWLTGFCISIITSGLLYNLLQQSVLYSVLTGGLYWWSTLFIAPVFFGFIVWSTEFGLVFCCFGRNAGGMNSNTTGFSSSHQDHHYYKEENVTCHASSWDTHTSVKRRNVRKQVSSPTTSTTTTTTTTTEAWTTPNTKMDVYNRTRLDSNRSTRSNDVFYDCLSFQDDGLDSTDDDVELQLVQPTEPQLLEDTIVEGSNSRTKKKNKTRNNNYHSTARYINSKCVYDDGSPAHVQFSLSPSTIPQAYKQLFAQNALTKWKETQQWRKERNLYKIHTLPHPTFSKIKDSYPHYIHGYTKRGYPVVYEKPGAMNLKDFFRNGGLIEDMLRHYTFFMEYLSNVLCNKPELRQLLDQRPPEDCVSHWGFTVAMDIKGISLSVLSGDVMRYLKQAGDINTAHYPVSITTAILLQSPFWLSGSFGVIKNILPSSTKAEILSASNQLEGLLEYIDEDQIPKEYGGSSPYPLGQHPFELELQELVESIKDNEDVDDEVVVEEEEEMAEEDDFVNHTEEHTTGTNPQPFYTPVADNTYGIRSREHASTYKDTQYDDFHDVEIGSTYNDEQNDSPLHAPLIDKTERGRKSPMYDLSTPTEGKNDKQIKDIFHSDEYVFCIVSIMHGLWCGVQGSLETALPLWLLTPAVLGGLGYEPRRTGFTLFSASIVLMWLLRTKASHILARIPAESPMRGYRIGVGAQAVLLMLLPFIAYVSKDDTMLVMTTTILMSAIIFIASMVGRSSSAILHFEATKSYVDKLSLRCDSTTGLGATLNRIVHFYRTGGFTYSLGICGEIAGAFFISAVFAHSTQVTRSFPFDASFSFYTGSILCSLLYMLSFSLFINNGTGEVMRRPLKKKMEGSGLSNDQSSRCALAREVFEVSVSDMASLFEESNWRASSALGRQGQQPDSFNHLKR